MITTSPTLAGCVVRPGILPTGCASDPSIFCTAARLPIEKTPGENCDASTGNDLDVPLLLVTTTLTWADTPPGNSSHGTTALIWFDCKYRSGASIVLLPLTNCTVTPPSVV